MRIESSQLSQKFLGDLKNQNYIPFRDFLNNLCKRKKENRKEKKNYLKKFWRKRNESISDIIEKLLSHPLESLRFVSNVLNVCTYTKRTYCFLISKYDMKY